jgi:hypothetical protein
MMIHNFATKNTIKKFTIRFMLTSMPDRNRKVSSYQRRFIDTVTEGVIMSLSHAFQDRREQAKPHVDYTKLDSNAHTEPCLGVLL